MKFVIKASTPDVEIATLMSPEEILIRFAAAKPKANQWSTEADRLRKYIQDNLASGQYGSMILTKKLGSPRMTATSLGNQCLQYSIIINPATIVKLKPGEQVIILNLAGEQLASGVLVDNTVLYNKNPPQMVDVMEIPDNDEPG